MNAPIDVSIILVTRNTRDLLRNALLSIRNSRDELVKEVVVVDNGSNDGTSEMISQEFPEIVYLPQTQNRGFAQANNLGAQRARGEFLCLMNSDARLKEDSLSKSIGYFRQNPICGIVGVQLLNTNGTHQNSIANYPTLATELLNKSLLRRLFPKRFPGKNQTFSHPTPVESVIGAYLLTRSSLWRELGGLDERYFFFMEETDFCLRVAKSGRTVIHLPSVEVWHDQGQTAKQVPLAARIEYWRSRYLYFDLHHSPLSCLILLMGLFVRLILGSLGNLLLSTFWNRSRNKLQEQLGLIAWHLQGQPESIGLPR